jgi:phospholipase C
MPKDLTRIKTIVVAMMENRSFDHILGYLGLPDSGHPLAARIEGIQKANLYYAHDTFPPAPITSPSINPDPPHEREDIAIQIGSLPGPMKGFVESYREKCPDADAKRVMEYCTKGYLPTTDFLARSFTICDNWFACLPASTLPNRLMAFSGYALVDHTPSGPLQVAENLFHDNPDDLVYDWLDARGIGWRLYYSGSFFFMQMPRMLGRYEADLQGAQTLFRSIDQLRDDFQSGDVPAVVFIEPLYQQDFRRGSAAATDNHSPASLYGGETFLTRVYDALSVNPVIWNHLLAIVTYDEHGSLFDHIKPPAIRTDPPSGAQYAQGFDTLGVRVPSILISPFVNAAGLYEKVLDHTSILKLLGEKFGGGRYTDPVDARPVNSVSDALDDGLLASAAVRAAPSKD